MDRKRFRGMEEVAIKRRSGIAWVVKRESWVERRNLCERVAVNRGSWLVTRGPKTDDRGRRTAGRGQRRGDKGLGVQSAFAKA